MHDIFGPDHYYILLNSIGRMKKSANRALIKVIEIKIPITLLGGWMEKSKTKNPKNSMIVVNVIALPVSRNVALMASSLLSPLPKEILYLLKK